MAGLEVYERLWEVAKEILGEVTTAKKVAKYSATLILGSLIAYGATLILRNVILPIIKLSLARDLL